VSIAVGVLAGLALIALDVFTDWSAHLSDFLTRPFRKENR
jgi:hypothetical protein